MLRTEEGGDPETRAWALRGARLADLLSKRPGGRHSKSPGVEAPPLSSPDHETGEPRTVLSSPSLSFLESRIISASRILKVATKRGSA